MLQDLDDRRLRTLDAKGAAPDPARRRTLVVMMAAFAVPILGVLALAALDGDAALNVVIVGVGVVAVLTPWATSGLAPLPPDVDHGPGSQGDE